MAGLLVPGLPADQNAALATTPVDAASERRTLTGGTAGYPCRRRWQC